MVRLDKRRGTNCWSAGLAASLLVMGAVLCLALLGAWLLPGKLVNVAPLFNWGIPVAALFGGFQAGRFGGCQYRCPAAAVGMAVAIAAAGLFTLMAPWGVTPLEMAGGTLFCTMLSLLAGIAGANLFPSGMSGKARESGRKMAKR